MGNSHRVIETPVYYFDQLSDAAKERARDWYRECSKTDHWWDSVYEDAERVANCLGIEIDSRKGSKDLCIYFSGFCSQGDGACFEGRYRYRKGWLEELTAYAPPSPERNQELHRIGHALQEVQARYFYKLEATAKHSGHYYHSGCTNIDVTHADDQYRDIGDAEDTVAQLLRDFMDWIYDGLEKESEWLDSEENVDECIVANEYEFDVNGDRV